MKEFLHHSRPTHAVLVLLLVVLAPTHVKPAPVENLDWQLQLLMTPNPSQLAAEERGRVFIYDSLEMGQINKALDQHFGRIQNMMFIRIHHLPPSGAGPAEGEDDECD